MKLPTKMLLGIERFLKLVPAETRQRGRAYHAEKRVILLERAGAEESYLAIVQGGHDYKVVLDFADNVWTSVCSCPMEYDCKHAVAAMFELQKRALADSGDRKSVV